MMRLLQRRLHRMRCIVSIVFCCAGPAAPVCGQASATPAGAQPGAGADYLPAMTFDVASIHESQRSDSYTVRFENPPHSSLLRLTNNDLFNLISMAYGVRRSQISGLPDWARSAMYTIEAKSDSDADEKLAKLTLAEARIEKQQMIQALLADRFALKVEWQTKEGTIYNIVVDKKTPKFGEAKQNPPSAEEVAEFGGHPIPPIYQKGDGRLGYKYIAHGATMADLAGVVAGQMGAEVVDETGLTGKYDFTFEYSGTVPGTGSKDPEAWPLLIEALPEQLGLKLQPAKGAIRMLAIEHVERPSPN